MQSDFEWLIVHENSGDNTVVVGNRSLRVNLGTL